MEVGQVWRFLPEQRDMCIVAREQRRLPSGLMVEAVVFEPVDGYGRDWWWRDEGWGHYWKRVE